MPPTPDPRMADFDFGGFLSTKFPLGSVQSAMTLLYQRVITANFVAGTDTHARVYYNLVVLFRLLWHHRILESTPKFWEQIYTDFPAKYGNAATLESVVAHYVGAREAFLQRYGAGKEVTFLARLVDQWRTRPPVDKVLIHVVRQAVEVYSRQAQESWAAMLGSERQRLLASKEMNWPVLVYYSVNKNKSLLGSPTGASGSKLNSKPNNGLKLAPQPLAGSPTLNNATGQGSRCSFPLALRSESDRATQVQQNSLLTPKSKREPGRLTPPVELQPGCQKTVALKLAEPHHGKNSGTNRRTKEAEPSTPTTPQKRQAPVFDELSPFSKRRLITLGVGRQQIQDGVGCSIVAKSSAQARGRQQVEEGPMRPKQRAGFEGSDSQGFGVPNLSVKAQSLGEMIASVTSGSPARNGTQIIPQPSLSLSEGLAFPVGDAPEPILRGGQIPPVVTYHANPSVLIDVPGSIFAFSRRIENLERIASGQVGAQGIINTLVRDMAKLEQGVQEQGDIRTVVASLSLQIEEFEKAGVDRDAVSASVSATTSALTSTIEGLEKKLGEATDTRTTIAALTRRIAELEKAAGERAAAYVTKVTGLETTVEVQSKILEDLMTMVEMQSKILEGLRLKEAGEIVE